MAGSARGCARNAAPTLAVCVLRALVQQPARLQVLVRLAAPAVLAAVVKRNAPLRHCAQHLRPRGEPGGLAGSCRSARDCGSAYNLIMLRGSGKRVHAARSSPGSTRTHEQRVPHQHPSSTTTCSVAARSLALRGSACDSKRRVTTSTCCGAGSGGGEGVEAGCHARSAVARVCGCAVRGGASGLCTLSASLARTLRALACPGSPWLRR